MHHIYRWMILLIPAFGYSYAVAAQNKEVLTAAAFIEQVRKYHPVAGQADLLIQKASADLLSARGNFDPVFELNTDNKNFDGKRYYLYSNPEIKVPTLFGVNLKTGIEYSNGLYANPEFTNGTASFIGIEVPLLKGLLMDKRRAALQQAKIYRDQSREEQAVMLNDLFYDAYAAYLDWSGSYRSYQVYTGYLANAGKRLQLVKLTYLNGDRALADTVEAFTQVQQYQLMQTDALNDLYKKTFELSGFLWSSKGTPYILPEKFIPDTQDLALKVPLPDLESQLTDASANHPLLKTYRYKLQDLEVERKLKFQDLLPIVNVRANVLSRDYYTYNKPYATYFENNYKFGVQVKVPLLLRQARGNYRQSRLKIRETQLGLNDKNWQLQVKIRQYHTEASLLEKQLNTARSMYGNYRFLLRNEELKFSQGESSLFLVNSREIKTLEIQQKLIELNIKYLKAIYAMNWASGTLK